MSEKRRAIITIITIVISIVIPVVWIMYYIRDNTKIISINTSSINIMEDKSDIHYHLDKVSLDNDYIEINGWIYEEGENIEKFNRSIILMGEEKSYKLKTFMKKREDLNTDSSEIDYSKSGFWGKGKIANNIKPGNYKIMIMSDSKIYNLNKNISIE